MVLAVKRYTIGYVRFFNRFSTVQEWVRAQGSSGSAANRSAANTQVCCFKANRFQLTLLQTPPGCCHGRCNVHTVLWCILI
jgi:hypothetical protein